MSKKSKKKQQQQEDAPIITEPAPMYQPQYQA